MGNITQFRALIWKSLWTRKYHLISTVIITLIPILLALLVAHYAVPWTPDINQNATINNLVSKNTILKKAHSNIRYILFAPDSVEVTKLMENVKEKISFGDAIHSMKNEYEMEKWLYKENKNISESFADHSYGIAFHTFSDKLLNYSIRNTKYYVWDTDILFPKNQLPGPMDRDHTYFFNGFLALQIAIDEAYMEMKQIKPINWTLQRFPYPAYKLVSDFRILYGEVIPLIIFLGYLFTVVTLVKSVSVEKESGIRVRMETTGAKPWITYAVWILDYGIVALFTATFLAIIFYSPVSLAGPLFEKSSFLVIWITIFLYYLLTIFYCIAVANLFPRARYAVLFAMCISFVSFGFVVSNKARFSPLVIFFFSILPNGFIILSINEIVGHELLADGATFSNMYTAAGNSSLPFGIIWLAALLGVLIFFVLILHFDAVFPGNYGTTKHWYWFMNQKQAAICKVWPIKRDRSSLFMDAESTDKTYTQKSLESVEGGNINKIEPVEGETPGIQIVFLTKKYGTFPALNDFSIDIYKNQITALLGHNGAGKTTLLSIITGMLPATSGDVYVGNNNIFHNFEIFRRDLGYCPQEDLLLPSLTVTQHIIFFGMIKGMSKSLATRQCAKLLNKCVLTHKKNTLVSNLSGGLKRRLCLAISLVNDPKFLILDEPTSGLDPESRRTIWDILLEVKRDCTVVFTTHFMEEADVIGERIAIMSHGQLKCYGSSLFLKKVYGSGYHITILLSPETTPENVQQIVSIVKNHIPETTVMHESIESIQVNFPLTTVEHFPSLFEELEISNELGFAGLTVTCTTIDDVFQKVHEEEGIKFHVDEVDLPLSYTNMHSNEYFRSNLTKIGSLLIAFINKRLIWIYRNWILSLLYLCITLFFIITVLNNFGEGSKDVTSYPLLLKLKIYSPTEVYMSNNVTQYSEPFKYQINEQGSEIIFVEGSQSVDDALLNFASKDIAKYRTSLIIAGNMKDVRPNVLYSSIAIHSTPIAVNLLTNSLINPKSTNSLSNIVYTYNHPYAFEKGSCSESMFDTVPLIMYTLMIAIAMNLFLSYFTVLPHIERKKLFKEIQLLGSLQYPAYWLMTFLVDFIIYFFINILIIICLLTFDSSGMMRNYQIAGNIFLIFLLFGFSSIWCAYFFSFLFSTYNVASTIYSLISIILALCGFFIYNFLGENWKYVFFFNPMSPFIQATYNVLFVANYNLMCEVCSKVVNELRCSDIVKEKILEKYVIGTELIYLGLDWIPYLFIIIVIDSGLVAFIWFLIKSQFIGSIEYSEVTDQDVRQEKDKINELIKLPDDEKPVLVVDGLAKKYSVNVTAVKDVSFAVSEGQCFGLLGTNGAGKSTTFNMITAYIIPSRGDAEIYGYSLKDNKMKYKAQIGYCPQAGGLLEDLTAKETLQFFARIRGIPGSEINQVVEKWIRLLGLTEYQNKKASTYSGGNLRKLSTAVALLGNPPVVFLDEPTTGVDPVTRRKIWQILKLMQRNNQTIVITSHSMEECEALCDRLTIMVKGTMRCIGNIQYLKKVHGKGFTILIKLNVINDEELNELKERMKSIFTDNCTLWNEYKGLLHYHLEDTTYAWSSLFRNMANLKAEFSAIDDYILTDASLEQVFLSFAEKDDEPLSQNVNESTS